MTSDFYKKYRQTEEGKKARRKAAQKYRNAHKDRIYCGHQIAWRIQRGKIIRPTECMSCGNTGFVEAHHPNYSQPLNIVWLCLSCHRDIHNAKTI